jgi:tetratricopeptide (TPR) repeat protein
MPTYKGETKFVMAGHAERFQMSACFKGSNKGDLNKYNANINFTCINCHNPHVSVKKTNQERFNQTCVSCHSANSGKSKLKDCSLSVSQRGSKTCVNCHMPSSDTRDIPHVSIHDHYIAKSNAIHPFKPKKPDGKQGLLQGLHAVNNSNPSSTELLQAYITYFEKFDPNTLYAKEANRLIASQYGAENKSKDATSLELQIHHLYNLQNYKDMVDLWEIGADEDTKEALLSDAWTQYRMAVAFDKLENIGEGQETSKNAKAIQHYKQAHEAMPLNTDFLAEYTNALVRANRTEEAKPLILEGLIHQPKHEQLLLNLGYCYYSEKQWSKAITTYNKALSLNPQSQATLSLIDLYLNVGDKEKAKQLYNRAKQWANPKILRSWSF